jgi:hypothetical protein
MTLFSYYYIDPFIHRERRHGDMNHGSLNMAIALATLVRTESIAGRTIKI